MIIRGHKIAAVSYLNTIPFIYGIEHAPGLHAGLVLSPPNLCVTAYESGAADVALIPVAAIPSLEGARLAGGYCIGASGGVRTVVLMSDSPLESIRTLYTDGHSVTSARLVAILCRELWDISPRFATLTDYGAIGRRREGDAFLLIGDKVFGYEGLMTYKWDLSDAWRELTGLPFVFAAWVARRSVGDEYLAGLDRALGYGVAHIPQAIVKYGHSDKPYAAEYLTKNIDYLFDDQKRSALSLFWEKGMKHFPRLNPG